MCRPGPFTALPSLLLALSISLPFFTGADRALADWNLAFTEDWSIPTEDWSTEQSQLHGARPPQRLFVGHELADYIIWFDGHCGWATQRSEIPPVRMKVVTRVYVSASQRNALSVNIRTDGGRLIYKYSMGGGGRVDANCQPVAGGGDDAVSTDLRYSLRVPYELYSIYEPGAGYYLGLRNLVTGEDRLLPRLWKLKGGGPPAMIDFDQEGGRGPVGLGRVEVWLDM